MAISYPLSLPTHTGIRSINLRGISQTAMTMSPFTYKQQIHNHAGQRWEAEVTLPPMKRESAEQWIAWLLSLNGRSGTFLMGDVLGATARGALGGSPVVNGANQTGSSLSIDGCTPSVSEWLKAGDYIQLGTNSSATLHKVLQDVDTDPSGQCSLDLFPSVRTAPIDGSAVTTSNAKGNFRLNTASSEWSINEASIYGMTFACVESII